MLALRGREARIAGVELKLAVPLARAPARLDPCALPLAVERIAGDWRFRVYAELRVIVASSPLDEAPRFDPRLLCAAVPVDEPAASCCSEEEVGP